MRYDSPAAMKIRRIGQRMGVLRPMVRAYRRLSGASYEEAFDGALLSAIRPGDTVWDIGANEGLYAAKAAEIVGAAGRVLAFEPSRAVLPRLRAAVKQYKQARIVETALSDKPGQASFFDTECTYTSSMSAKDGEGYTVQVNTGDEFLASDPPNVVKIDVEGFEGEVIEGLQRTLASPMLRGVFVEVHFLELANRGLSDAPRRICQLLDTNGLRVKWVDPSHIAATRSLAG
jgi:FkbM family methyltransferase